jgi:adenylate cyclase class 2
VRYIEVEQKYAVTDPDALIERLTQLDAAPVGDNVQVDEYFNAPHRDFLAPEAITEWLRIRHDERGPSLNYKQWLPTDAPSKTHCDEYETAIGDIEAVRRTLQALNFTPIVTVHKRRREWRINGDTPVTVAVDTIDRLGTFVEFEFTGTADTVDEAITRLNGLVSALGWPLGERIQRGYPHMLLGRQQ